MPGEDAKAPRKALIARDEGDEKVGNLLASAGFERFVLWGTDASGKKSPRRRSNCGDLLRGY